MYPTFFIMKHEFLFIGHSGTRTDLDENTIVAFKKVMNSEVFV